MKKLTCCECGRGFLWNRKKKYCSSECAKSRNLRVLRVKHDPKPCIKCGADFVPKRATAKICHDCRYHPPGGRCAECDRPRVEGSSWCELCSYLRKAERGDAVLFSWLGGECKYCHKILPRPKNNQQRVWCSNACRLNYKKRSNGAKSKCVKYWEPVEPKFTPVRFRRCRSCGAGMVHRASSKKDYCAGCLSIRSEFCWRRIEVGEYETECGACGVTYSYIPGGNGIKRHGCSDACSAEIENAAKRAHKAKRRKHIKRGETIDPFSIFERDGWRCRCCGRKTPKADRGTYKDSAPELDHIIPVSVGGKHKRQNVQLLCRACNSLKGNGSLHDQQLLFG